MKMMARLALVVLSLLPCLALAQHEPPMLYTACHERSSRFEFSIDTADSNMQSIGTRRETIAINDLVKYSEPDERGRVHRAGSNTIVRTCGRLTARVSGGFYNARVGGELGAADDYAIIDLFEGDRHIAGPIALGTCSTNIARYSYMVPCPDDWAIRVLAFESSGDFVVSLHHDYGEYRRP